jgi:hypothetical protein
MTAKENVSTGSERSAGAGGGCALGTRASPTLGETTGCCDTCRCSFWRSYAGQTTCWDCREDHQWDEEAFR